MPDLSVVIPARKEEWLERTVLDVLSHAKADTEVIAVLDGEWPDPGLPQHPRLRVVYHKNAIGQRACTNLGVKVSTARYVMKLDAHCSLADGFDVTLIESAEVLGEDVTQIPAQKNLHIYDVVCACGWRQYQGVVPTMCPHCHSTEVRREVVWRPRSGSTNHSWIFDHEPRFQYDRHRRQRQPQGDYLETMSSLGACFFMTRERFWQLGGLDESHGSWGSFGIEIGCKSWLSGGRQVTNLKTWFAHFFRVGGIKFPYPITGREQEKAREYARALWFTNAWPGQVKPLSWLVEHFRPVQGWHDPEGVETLARINRAGEDFGKAPALVRRGPTKGIVYYSDNRPDPAILAAARASIERAGLPIVAVTLGPIEWPAAKTITFDGERGYLTMFQQILAGVEAADAEVLFFAEHDVLYHPSHFDFTPERRDTYYYNEHVWKVNAETGHALHYWCNQTSGLCAYRSLLLPHYRARVQRVRAHGFDRAMGFEPGTHRPPRGVDDYGCATWRSPAPNVDIRHGANLTPSRWRKDQFRNQKYTQGWTEADRVPGWGLTAGRFAAFLAEHTPALTTA